MTCVKPALQHQTSKLCRMAIITALLLLLCVITAPQVGAGRNSENRKRSFPPRVVMREALPLSDTVCLEACAPGRSRGNEAKRGVFKLLWTNITTG